MPSHDGRLLLLHTAGLIASVHGDGITPAVATTRPVPVFPVFPHVRQAVLFRIVAPNKADNPYNATGRVTDFASEFLDRQKP